MRVIIAGSRGLIPTIEEISNIVIDSQYIITEVVSGGAKGVDLCGERWAEYFRIPIKQFLPDWNGLGKCAGCVRNELMGDYSDALIAIWDQRSHGTEHMINYMKKLNKPIFVTNRVLLQQESSKYGN